MISALAPEMIFDLMAVRLNEDNAKDRNLIVAFRLRCKQVKQRL